MRRAIFKAVFCLVLALMVVLGALTSPRTAAALKPWLVGQASDMLGVPVTVGRLEVAALPLSVSLTDIAVGAGVSAAEGAADKVLQVRVHRLQMWPAIMRSFLGRPVLAKVVLHGLEITAQLPPPNASSADPAPASLWPRQRPLPVDVLEADITDVDVAIVRGAVRYRTVGLSVHLGPYHRRGRPLVIDGPYGDLTHPALFGPGPKTVNLHAQGIVQGRLHRPTVLTLTPFTLGLQGLNLAMTGDLDLTGEAPDSALTALVRADLQDLRQLVPALPTVTGELFVKATVQHPWLAWRARLDATITQLGRVGMAPLGDLVLSGQAGDEGLWLEQLRLGQRGAEILYGEGHIRWAAPHPFELMLQLKDTSLADVMAQATGTQSPWSGALAGVVMGQGALGPHFHLRSSWDVTATPLALAGKHNAAVLQIPELTVRGQCDSTQDVTLLHNVSLWARGSQLVVDGAVHHRAPAGGPWADARLWAGGFDLEDLGPIAKIPYRGTAGIGGTWTGPLGKPTLKGHARVEHFGIGNVALGISEGVVTFCAPTLSLDHLSIHEHQGLVSGSMTLHFLPQGLMARSDFEVHDVDVGALAQTFGLSQALARPLSGRLFGPVHLDGPFAHPKGTAVLASPTLRVGQMPLGATALSVHFGEGASRVAAHMTSQPPEGALSAHVDWGEDNRLHGEMTGRGLPLTLLPALAAANLAGTATLALNVDGPPDRLVGGATFNIEDVAVDGLSQGGVHLVARLQDKALNLSLSMLRGGLHADGDFQLGGPLMGRIQGGLDGLNLAPFLPLVVPRLARQGDDLSVVASGHFEALGPFARPQNVSATAELTALQVALRGATLKLRRPAAVLLQHHRVHVAPLALQGPLLDIHLVGDVPLALTDPRLSVTFQAHGDLAALSALSPVVDSGHGRFAAQMAFSHTLAAPRMMGEATIHSGSLRLVGQDRPLDHIEARAVFTGRTAAITTAHATLGDGRLTLAGEAHVGTGSWRDPQGLLSLRLHMRRVPFRPAADVEAVASGNLELTGGLLDNALRGDVTLDALRYMARIDLDKLVPKRAAPPLRAPMMPAGRATRLAIRLRAPGNLLISSAVLEAELAADLTVTGTTDRVGLLGGVKPLWARAKWRDNLYVLTRSSIDFVDEYRVAPQFNVVAHTHACQMDADVQIQGGVEGVTVTPSGRDERGMVDPQDVLTCLQFGLRLRDFDGNQKSGATAGAWSSGLDALWTVSGLDAKVRKFLPIAVDELRLTSGWSSNAQRTTPRVVVAKELGNHISLRYFRSIDEYNDQAFNIDYKVAEHASLSAGWLTARDVDIGDFGLDLRLQWSLR